MMLNDESLTDEFIESWQSMSEFFNDLPKHFAFAPEICRLMEQMQKKGYNKTLRAGQSMSDLILSRSRKYGLRQDQARLTFSARRNGMAVTAEFDGKEEILSCAKIELTSQVESLLKRLEAREIT